jgi:hypothetical protein
VGDFGFEGDGVVDLKCRNIKLKLCFGKDDWINWEKWTVSEGFNGNTISTKVYLFTKIWAGLVVEEEEVCNFCFTSMFVTVTMAEKITYKKKRVDSCTTGYKLRQVENPNVFCLLVKSKNQI